MECTIPNIDQLPGWEKAVGPDINPVAPGGYEFVQLPSGIRLYECGPAYGGWLAKKVSPFVYKFPQVSLSFKLVLDPATLQQAQVVEFDSKITDEDGWTYDFSAQLVIVEGWAFQVTNQEGTGWLETGAKLRTFPAVGQEFSIQVDYVLDFVNHKSQVVRLIADGQEYPINTPVLDAKQIGWQKSSILTQLQQCNNALRGAHAEEFRKITYTMSA